MLLEIIQFFMLSRSELFLQSCLLRSSQPGCGITTKRCKEDEKILNETLSSDSKGLIFDTRNAASIYNSKGKGTTTLGFISFQDLRST